MIERLVDALDEYGVRREAWTLIRTVKAQIIQASAEDFLSSAGVAAESVMIFRVRFREEITPADGPPPTQKGRTSTARRSKLSAGVAVSRSGLTLSRVSDCEGPQTRA